MLVTIYLKFVRIVGGKKKMEGCRSQPRIKNFPENFMILFNVFTIISMLRILGEQ